MFLAQAYDVRPRGRRAGYAGLSIAPIAFAALLIVPLLPPTIVPIKGLLASVVMASALTAECGKVLPEIGVLALIGDASYSLYLTHSFVVQGLTKAAGFLGGATPAQTLLLVAVSLGVSCWVAILCHRAFERPSHVWVRALMLGRTSVAARPALAS